MRIFHAAAIVSASTLAGCSFIYTGDNLVGPAPDPSPTDAGTNDGAAGDATADASTDVFVDGIPGISSIDANLTHVYWCNTAEGTIVRRRVDGASTETMASKEASPRFVTLSSAHVYWTSGKSIRRIALQGGGTAETYVTAAEEPSGLVYDVAMGADSLYWSERAAGRVKGRGPTGEFVFRDPLDAPGGLGAFSGRVHVVLGSGRLINFSSFGGGIFEIDATDTAAVEVTSERTFWTKPKDGAVVRRDGSQDPTAVAVDAAGAAGVAAAGDFVYWAEPSLGRIRRRKL